MKNKKKLIIILICVGIIFISSSLAFFIPGVSNNSIIGQNTLSNIEDTIKLEIDETLKKDNLVPIEEEYVTTAAKKACVDDLGNSACSLYNVKITNNAEVAQKIHVTLNIEKNTFENYRLLIYKGRNIKEALTEAIILPKNDLKQEKIDEMSTTLLPEQTVIYNLVYYVNNVDDNTNDINQQFLASISVNTEVTGDYTGTGKGEVDLTEIDLNDGLIPIYYNEDNKWEITTIDDSNWYDYDKQKWANAAVLTSSEYNVVGDTINVSSDEGTVNTYAMFVWIPRFSYTIGCTDINNDGNIDVDSTGTNSECLGYKIEGASDLAVATPGAIDIKFINVNEKDELDIDGGTYPNYTYTSESDRNPTNWYTHPAFTFGSDELSGIWIGKFETTGTSTTPTILPNVTSLRSQTISVQFATAQKFSASNNVYRITGDAHMAKNSEWAAVAYLSQSKYGKYGNSSYSGALKEIYKNDSNSYYTGRSEGTAPRTSSYSSSGTYKYDVEINGTGASTTGNIYGVYDMAGGASDYVMGNYNNTVAESGFSSNWFTTEGNAKYYDKFTTTTPFTTKSKETIGQLMIETANWYSKYNYNTPSTSSPYFINGGDYIGGCIFGSANADGIGLSYRAFRSVLVMTGT